ncbi:MAG: DUF1311 domain-containing protein [Acidobacteria bacterium]|nr:DUF1311 domain-containing protein [Acidobacteriota bacterium]
MNTRGIRQALPLLIIAFTPLPALAQTQAEMDREACGEYQKSDAELNRVYRQVLDEYKADALFAEKLRVAQRAWVAYRDAQLGALYPARDPRRAYGSVHRMCRCQALTELTLERTEALRRWVMGVEEGDVCAGSIRIRGYTGGSRHRAKPNKGMNRTRTQRASHPQR